MFLLLLAAIVLDLPPSTGNPRNTEGSFIRLKNGHILYAYSKFEGDNTADHTAAHIAARTSTDGGRTWTTQDQVLVPNDGGLNVMSVSFLRLRSGEIALFTLRKNSMLDCRPILRLSRDEGKTWSAPRPAFTDPGYFVLNNDRAVQLKSGRLLLPVALHKNETDDPKRFNGRGIAMAYLSDDKGKTWRRSKSILENPASPNGFQEPGIVQLRDGRLLMFLRTSLGSQYFSYSKDGGDTWTEPVPSPLRSPLSPASIKRIPKTGHLFAVWNDTQSSVRTPLTVAISKDEGITWQHAKTIETDPTGWYCYTAIAFIDNRVLLGYISGGAGLPRLSRSVVNALELDWLYSTI